MTKTDLYHQIIEPKNLQEAYLEVYQSFLEKSTVYRYEVIDAQQIHQTELYLEDFLNQLRQELINFSPLRMALSVSIPKKNGKVRKIYMLPIRERVKCQAIYRVLQEYLKPFYSKYLYSFRSERPSYFALRSLKRFYQRNLNQNYHLLKTDFKDYSDHIDKTILLNQLADLGVDSKTLQLVKQFIEMAFVRTGGLQSMSEGIMQGIPLVSLFNNIYMSAVDQKIGSEVAFYRRVGDDIIAIDKSLEKLNQSLNFIKEECLRKKILINQQKTTIQPLESAFEYLGLNFESGKISIPSSKLVKIIDSFKLKFKTSSDLSQKVKIAKIRRLLAINSRGNSAVFNSIVLPHNLVNHTVHLQLLSSRIMQILWAFLGGGFTSKKIAQGKLRLQKSGLKINSLFQHFQEFFQLTD